MIGCGEVNQYNRHFPLMSAYRHIKEPTFMCWVIREKGEVCKELVWNACFGQLLNNVGRSGLGVLFLVPLLDLFKNPLDFRLGLLVIRFAAPVLDERRHYFCHMRIETPDCYHLDAFGCGFTGKQFRELL
jgi:hypothetical protein